MFILVDSPAASSPPSDATFDKSKFLDLLNVLKHEAGDALALADLLSDPIAPVYFGCFQSLASELSEADLEETIEVYLKVRRFGLLSSAFPVSITMLMEDTLVIDWQWVALHVNFRDEERHGKTSYSVQVFPVPPAPLTSVSRMVIHENLIDALKACEASILLASDALLGTPPTVDTSVFIDYRWLRSKAKNAVPFPCSVVIPSIDLNS